MSITIKTQPERYRAPARAVAYHQRIRRRGFVSLSHTLELYTVRRALDSAAGGDSVLDVPCGTGRIDKLLRQRFATVVGIDSSPNMLDVYRREDGNRIGGCSDIFHLPFDDDSFDWSICHRYFHHLHNHGDRVALLRSLGRVSRLGIIFYAWIDTPLNRRKSTMRTSVSINEIEATITESGLREQARFRCSGPVGVKTILVCRHQ